MEPDVIRMYSSSPPPMEDGAEEEDDEFGDFGGFSGVPNSISFTEFDTPTTFNQAQALAATSPPELMNNRGVVGVSGLSSANGTHSSSDELSKANGVVPGGRQGGGPSERTVSETKKVLSNSLDFSGSGQAGSEPVDCNGGGTEVLTNGFATFEVQGSPSLQNSVHSHKKGTSTEDTGSVPAGGPEDDFADFAAFSNAEGHLSQTANEDLDNPDGGSWLAEGACQEHCNIEQGMTLEDDVRDTNRTGPDASGSDSISVSAEAPGGSGDGDRGSNTDADFEQRDIAFAHERSAPEAVCTKKPLALNGVGEVDGDGSEDAAGCGENDLSPETTADGEAGKGSGNETETETETETSFGRPLSTDALEEYGDMSTTGSAPSPPLREDTATPADHSQLAEDDDDDEDFGDFGDAGSFGGQGFADFDQLDVQQERSGSSGSAPAREAAAAEDEDDFGDFDTPKFHTGGTEGADGGEFADFPVSDSFGNFSSAAVAADGEADAGWSAFDQPDQQQEEGESWAAFSEEQSAVPPPASREEEQEEEEEEEEWQETEPPAFSDQTSRTDRHSASLSGRLERLFQSSFPQTPVAPVGEEVTSLKTLLEPPDGQPQPGREEGSGSPRNGVVRGGVWRQLQDIHEAFGLRHQWGGSHCNKTLLCSLGIDIRNILFTGQKKQPVIVPMYAASLGMLEPTKEPVKPISAAEMIASIAQAPAAGPEKSSCPPDTVQEVLPPVQFDWSSSGLTNPLDGVDPELYELTTAKLDPGSSGSRVADAFARLMSTMEKTSTSTRKPRKEENLSEEAAKVIAGLPDLSFMQAKVLMFPATLTPLGCQATPD
ncbi:aftiphilin a isoform X2 [Centroberyx affinis]|uniref:aftiphilin a isoform X2 n=1 Tax=Centroberyx affinis TaxID=166261 RepID=UPI003A5BA735